MGNHWSEIIPGMNIKFEVGVGTDIYRPVFHVSNVEPTQIRQYTTGLTSISASGANGSWLEITDSGGTVSVLEPESQFIMYDVKVGVYPSTGVVHMQWPENTFYGILRGKGSATDVYGGALGTISSFQEPTFQIFNIFDNGHPTFQVYNSGGATTSYTLRFTVDRLKTEFIGLSSSWNDPRFSSVNTGIPLVTVGLGGLRPFDAPGWLEHLINKRIGE